MHGGRRELDQPHTIKSRSSLVLNKVYSDTFIHELRDKEVGLRNGPFGPNATAHAGVARRLESGL